MQAACARPARGGPQSPAAAHQLRHVLGLDYRLAAVILVYHHKVDEEILQRLCRNKEGAPRFKIRERSGRLVACMRDAAPLRNGAILCCTSHHNSPAPLSPRKSRLAIALLCPLQATRQECSWRSGYSKSPADAEDCRKYSCMECGVSGMVCPLVAACNMATRSLTQRDAVTRPLCDKNRC